jgi:hypothetical protein
LVDRSIQKRIYIQRDEWKVKCIWRRGRTSNWSWFLETMQLVWLREVKRGMRGRGQQTNFMIINSSSRRRNEEVSMVVGIIQQY